MLMPPSLILEKSIHTHRDAVSRRNSSEFFEYASTENIQQTKMLNQMTTIFLQTFERKVKINKLKVKDIRVVKDYLSHRLISDIKNIIAQTRSRLNVNKNREINIM